MSTVNSSISFESIQKSHLPAFETALESSISFLLPDQRTILESAIKYSVLSGGKRIRPLICLCIGDLFDANQTTSMPLAVAIELMHCYSLIHDDLPAMDNDDYRRGQLTCHKKFSEDIAILAGDILNTYVFEYISKELPKVTSLESTIYAIQTISNKCGLHGMAGGQLLDLVSSSNTKTTDISQLETIHQLKTGSLLQCCFHLPATLAKASQKDIRIIDQLGQHYGLLFQIVDDIIDETGTLKDIGKSPGKDAEQNKLTYVTAYGLDQAIAFAKKQYDDCCDLLTKLPGNTNAIQEICRYTMDKGVSK